MAKQASIVCMNCGKEILAPVKFCPYCSAELPGTEEDKPAGDSEHGYWDFYGMADHEDVPETGIGARGWLRFAAAVVFVAAIIVGFSSNGWSWSFRWERAALIWGCGCGLAVILFALSFAFKKPQ